MKNMTEDQFNTILELVKAAPMTARQWAELNYEVWLDNESGEWVSRSPDSIGDELWEQALRVERCIEQPEEQPDVPNTIGPEDALSPYFKDVMGFVNNLSIRG